MSILRDEDAVVVWGCVSRFAIDGTVQHTNTIALYVAASYVLYGRITKRNCGKDQSCLLFSSTPSGITRGQRIYPERFVNRKNCNKQGLPYDFH